MFDAFSIITKLIMKNLRKYILKNNFKKYERKG